MACVLSHVVRYQMEILDNLASVLGFLLRLGEHARMHSLTLAQASI